jgi:hypothetical protein
MWHERTTGQNSLSTLFAGVPRFPEIRGGNVRAQAAFGHSILAGVFGATLLPLFVGLWSKRYKLIALLGTVSALVVAVSAGGSTALLALLSGIAALLFWPARRQMRIFRWAVTISLVCLHLVMKAPVWALVGRVGLVDGSSGYHREMLVDQTIRHFGDWWLVGVRETESWGWSMWDTSNFYVEVAVTGGLITLVCFITVIVRSFKTMGRARSASEGDLSTEWYCWTLGAALFATAVAFFGVTYFDQTIVVWYVLLAMVSRAGLVSGKTTGNFEVSRLVWAVNRSQKTSQVFSTARRARKRIF